MRMTSNAFLKATTSLFVIPTSFVFLACGTALSQTTSEIAIPLSGPKTKSTTAAEKQHGVHCCLVQKKHVEGVTHPKKLYLNESSPAEYYVLKPSFVLKAKHIKKCELKKTNPPFKDKFDFYTLYIEINDLGREEMHKAFKDLKPAEFVMVVHERAFPVRITFAAKSVEETKAKISLGYFVDKNYGESFVKSLKSDESTSKKE